MRGFRVEVVGAITDATEEVKATLIRAIEDALFPLDKTHGIYVNELRLYVAPEEEPSSVHASAVDSKSPSQ